MDELIARLEKATGPDDALALELLVAVHGLGDGQWFGGTGDCGETEWQYTHRGQYKLTVSSFDLPDRSLDAAVKLVEEKRQQKGEWSVDGFGNAAVFGNYPQAKARAATPALALCLALLRALDKGGDKP